MSQATTPVLLPRSRRTFTKIVVGLNIALCWAAIFYSTYTQQSEVAVAALAIIAAFVGAYMGVGHLDFRAVITAFRNGGGMSYFNPNDTSGQDQ